MLGVSRMLCLLILAGPFGLAGAAPATTADDAARALHLLGYIGADYPATVDAGKIVDAGEYAEQLEFLGVLQTLIAGLPAHGERLALEQGVRQLLAAIEQR